MPLNEDHLREIGRIAIAFNSLERRAQFAVQALMGDDTPVVVWQALTVGEPFDRLTFRIRTLARIRLPYPDFLSDLEAWIREAKKVQEERNRVLHTGWISFSEQPQDSDVATALRQTTRNTYGELRDYTPRDLYEIAQRISEVERRLRTLTSRMRQLPMSDSYPEEE
jgi:hypothetical protein